MTPSIFGTVSSPSRLGMSQSAAPLITLILGRSNSETVPLAMLMAKASWTAAASSGGMDSALGAVTFTSSCDNGFSFSCLPGAEFVNERELERFPERIGKRRPHVLGVIHAFFLLETRRDLASHLANVGTERIAVVVLCHVLAQLGLLQCVGH